VYSSSSDYSFLVVASPVLDQGNTFETIVDSTGECPRTPDQYNIDQEFDDRGVYVWVYVTREKWGKHPRKMSR
jgi:hypothetical protein